MDKGLVVILAITLIVFGSGLIIGAFVLINVRTKKKINDEIENLEREKNSIMSAPLITEFNKVEGLINNDNLKIKYEKWKKEYETLEGKEIPKLNDKLIEVETFLSQKNYKSAEENLAKTELDIFYVKSKADNLLESIKELTLSEERNREIITKLKSLYREIVFKYNKSKDQYKDVSTPIELQFETIDKLFGAFEVSVKNNEYEEISKIVKALESLIKNISIVIDESPTIILLGKMVLPKKMNDVKTVHKKLSKDGYNLEYLNIDYNIQESEKKLGDVFDKLNVLNLEDSIFELKTMVDYFESLYNDFEKEKRSKKDYERSIIAISEKLSRLSKIIKNVYAELGDLKDTYDLTNEELSVIDDINKDILKIKDDFKLVNDRTLTKVTPYSKLYNECELLSVRLSKTEDTLETTLKNLGSLKEDEARARDQLSDIKVILKEAKFKISEYKLPVIPEKFYIELREAHEAVKEIVKELEKKPISIKTLNLRVDTARDLALKLNNTSRELSKTAAMAEMAIVYGNRYRSSYKEVESGLLKSERAFYKGDYKSSLETALNALNIVEPNIHKKLISRYQE